MLPEQKATKVLIQQTIYHSNMNTEQQLQSKTAREFSERFPHLRGQFFHVSNERNSKEQAWIAKAIGIFPGVSDFLFFKKNNAPIGSMDKSINYGTILISVELKLPGKTHTKDKIRVQLEWAKILESQGGHWRLCLNSEDAISCTQMDFKGYTIEQVENMLDSNKNKTITF